MKNQQTIYYQNQFNAIGFIVSNHVVHNFQNTINSMADINQVIIKIATADNNKYNDVMMIQFNK